MRELTKREAALLQRLRDGEYYTTYEQNRIPKSMAALVELGLVTTALRITRLERCYVPAQNYEPYAEEQFT